MPERTWKYFSEVSGDCSFALRLSADHLDDHRDSKERSHPVTHAVCHTTGATWIAKQIDKRVRAGEPWTDDDLLHWALDYYWRKGGTPRTSTSAHYFNWVDGRVWQLSDEHLAVPHVGVSKDERAKYLNGGWRRGEKAQGQGAEGLRGPVSERAITEWDAAYPHYKSPQHLFPTRYVNECSLGVEHPPCVVRTETSGLVTLAEPLRPGLRHTWAQHVSFSLVVLDAAERWGWGPLNDWLVDPRGGPHPPRVGEHSSYDLYGRSTAKAGMWDVGGLRSDPWWDWQAVYATIRTVAATRGAIRGLSSAHRSVIDSVRTIGRIVT